jgi:uncharacterized protein (TIGR02145 family)
MKNVKSTLLTAGFVLAMALTFSCSSDEGDDNDIKNYRTVVIGTQTWMAENLNYNIDGSKCYNNDPANCKKYGRLYDWKTAMKACPSGWHLSTNSEWYTLTDYVANTQKCCSDCIRAECSDCTRAEYTKCVCEYLKATSGWNFSGNGLDTYGFTMLPGGGGYSGDYFRNVGDAGFWWTSDNDRGVATVFRYVNYDDDYVSWHDGDKPNFLSVRCVKE